MSFRSSAITISIALILGSWFSSSAGAGTVTITSQTFDVNPPISATQTPGTWYTDRYAPAGFSSVSFLGDNRLAVQLSESDGANNRPPAFSSSFYNTQGRKYDTPGATTLSIDMFIDSSFDGLVGRTGGLWGVAVDGANAITSYPIIEFFDSQFQVWDSGVGWVASGLPAGFAYDTFVTLSIVLDVLAGQVNLYADGDLLQTISAFGATSFANAIIQGINTTAGINRTLYFDNFTATAPIPLPAALPLFGAGLAGMGLIGWRRKRKAVAGQV